MFIKEVIDEKLGELFDIQSKAIIQSTGAKQIILVETTTDYVLVTIKDFTDQPIGNYDIFVEHRVRKGDSHLTDMANMISFLQMDSEKNILRLQERIFNITTDLIDAAKSFNENTILASSNENT
ncbi:hypothetical protein IIE26_27225 (plasmid) [Cytobacillus oceanisediminis]|uniref:hypothetical protein n=1 Tax=Cytobacillus oceanisediminis TaxID=665099 RepID=UPI001864FCD9|nr:hypothetical protein [Cytobacillus oceanisediminis]QOK30063.1 hypothetical protein IIE26_27225 [Cytobacillus oceanisediminis]